MATLTLQQATQYARDAGFSGTALATIIAIAIRESSLITDNYNQTPVETSVGEQHATGILQFLPSTFEAYANPYLPNDPNNPQSAFAAAYNVFSQTGGFGPWTCDTECNQPKGQGVTPTSPNTVLGGNGQPIPLPADFAAATGYTGGSLSNPTAPAGSAPSGIGQSSGSGNINLGPFSIPTAPLQNIGVGILGLVILLGGFLVLASPTINSQVIQPAKKRVFS